MAETDQQESTLSETIVKEAVGLGMDSPLRDSILEAVDEAEGSRGGGSGLPLAGALFGLGAALGFLAGRQSPELEDTALEDIEEPEIIEDVMEGEDESESVTDMASEAETETETEVETEAEDGGGSGRLGKLLLAVGAIAAIVLARRQLSGGTEEEWEPIEEFEPATTGDEESADEDEGMETEAGTDEFDEIDEE